MSSTRHQDHRRAAVTLSPSRRDGIAFNQFLADAMFRGGEWQDFLGSWPPPRRGRQAARQRFLTCIPPLVQGFSRSTQI